MNICDPYSGSPLVAEAFSPPLTNHTQSPFITRHILVVDDSPGVRDILASILRRADYEVTCAGDGEDGWDALCSQNFDGMITDHDMPRLSGLDLIRRVRAVPLNLPIIMISGQMPWEETDFLELLPPGTALAKPLSFSEVLTAVNRVFFKNSATRQIPRRNNNTGHQVPCAAGAFL